MSQKEIEEIKKELRLYPSTITLVLRKSKMVFKTKVKREDTILPTTKA